MEWEYEVQGYELADGIYYLPDFLLHNVAFNHAGYKSGQDIYVEVKGQMTDTDAQKIKLFAKEKPILLVEEIPVGEKMLDLCDDMDRFNKEDPTPYNFETVDGDWFGAYPGVDLDGIFNLFGADSSYLNVCDERTTVNAYRKARCVRFEKGDVIVEKLKKGKL